MKINYQLFEDVLSGKLKGTFVLRDGSKISCRNLTKYNDCDSRVIYPYLLDGYSYTLKGRWDTDLLSEKDIIDFIPDPNMKENELTIELPKGKIVDWDESKKQNKIVLKDKQLTYEEICEKLFEDGVYYINILGKIWPSTFGCKSGSDPNNATTEHQLQCILTKNKLANVAKYLNNGWKPSKDEHVFTITCCGDFKNKPIVSEHYFGTGENLVLFQTQKKAKQAIEILGEETVKLALEPLGI